MGARQTYDDQTKAAVLASLLAGQAVSYVAKEYDIPEGTVASWKARELRGVNAADLEEKQAVIGPKLLDYMVAALDTLRAQLIVMGDPEWLRKQSAADLAVLAGVQVDKLMRMFEALDRAKSVD